MSAREVYHGFRDAMETAFIALVHSLFWLCSTPVYIVCFGPADWWRCTADVARFMLGRQAGQRQ